MIPEPNLFPNLHRRFRDNIRLHPQRYCISAKRCDYTYKEIDNRSSQLFNVLRGRYHVNNKTNVAVLLSEWDALSLLAVTLLKIDATFLFIDSQINQEDIRQILQDNAAALLITEKRLSFVSDKMDIKTILMEDIAFPADVRDTADEPQTNSSFIIYTGTEKGYTENIIAADSLAETLSSLDKAVPSVESDKICFAGSIPLNEFLIEVLHAILTGKHVILSPGSPLENFENDETFSMDFSLFYFGSYSSTTDPDNKYNLLLESVKHGDQNGYSAVWTPERHFNEFGGLFPNPSILGAALAVVTSRVQVRAGSIVSPLHHSVRIAEDWSIIDNLSRGRAALSFASGWQCDDFVFYPERYEGRHQQMMEQIEEVKSLWQGGSMELKNGLGKSVKIEVFPKPIQASLPIWVTVSGKTETFIDAGKIGANILTHLLWQDSSELKEKIAAYRLSLKHSGFDPAAGIVSVMLHTFVGESDEGVKAIVRNPLKEYIKSSVHLIEAMTRSTNAAQKETVGRYGNVNDKIPAHLLDELVEIAFNRFFDEAALLGSPEKCHRQLKRLRDYGVNELACLIDFGLDKKTILDGLEQLTKLKANYDFKVTKRYPLTLLRTSAETLEEMTNHKGFQTSSQSLRKIVFAGARSDVDFSSRNNVLELKYDFSNTGSFVEQVGACEHEHKALKDLSIVNSVISEDF